jgi:hypothetical protein
VLDKVSACKKEVQKRCSKKVKDSMEFLVNMPEAGR